MDELAVFLLTIALGVVGAAALLGLLAAAEQIYRRLRARRGQQ